MRIACMVLGSNPEPSRCGRAVIRLQWMISRGPPQGVGLPRVDTSSVATMHPPRASQLRRSGNLVGSLLV